ncbi:TlpA family protein disulfide reductase [Lawsonibacter sp. LCP25S3_G6]|uniref:TlpA family protein disulfide reductase n=1 Tax=unclassified Lawsonibacter TaxID=2617946 RepID=UPI003F9CBA4B
MKGNKTFFVLALVFVLLLGGAYALYQRLSPGQAGDNLAIAGSSAQSGTDTSSSSTSQSDADRSQSPSGSTGSQSESSSAGTQSSQEEGEPELTLAPDFTVYDKEGNEVHLSDFVGKPIVLNFWASWCSPCKSEMPDFNQAYLDYGEEVNFLMVNMTDGSRETVESASAFIEEQGYEFPVFYDTDYDAALTYGAYALPTTYFIDAEGYGVAWAQSALSAENLQKGLDMILPQ